MSFTIELMRNNSDNNVVNKSVQVTSTVTGVLRSSTSIIDPVVTIQTSVPSEVISQSNYMHISSFGRYYYITNVVSEYNGLWTLHSHVDVLMSFKSSILQQTAVVARQEYRYNLYLDDGSFMAYQNPVVDRIAFSDTSPFNSAGQYVLIVAGGSST